MSPHTADDALPALVSRAAEPWGGSMTDEDGAVALLGLHLDESLATRDPHETGWWTYGNGFFHPVPPRMPAPYAIDSHGRRAVGARLWPPTGMVGG